MFVEAPERFHLGRFVLVDDFADKLFYDILDGDDASGSAVLIENDGEMNFLILEIGL